MNKEYVRLLEEAVRSAHKVIGNERAFLDLTSAVEFLDKMKEVEAHKQKEQEAQKERNK